MKKSKFYICPHCRNIAQMVYDTDIPLYCCGDKMNELIPGAVEASKEKHIPAVQVTGDMVQVNVGSVDHPMESVHYIEWVQLDTDKGSYRRFLQAGDAPQVSFRLSGEVTQTVYAYCNLHGLWKKDLI